MGLALFINDYLADRERFIAAAHELEKYAPAKDYRDHQEKLAVARAILDQPDLKPETVNLEAAFITAASELKSITASTTPFGYR